jgi:hypothetical protein
VVELARKPLGVLLTAVISLWVLLKAHSVHQCFPQRKGGVHPDPQLGAQR